MLKGRSLKSCVALVVFCFSLVVACIKPVWAADPRLSVYASIVTSDPVMHSDPFPVPCSTSSLVYTSPNFTSDYNVGAYFNFASNHFEPFGFPVTLYFIAGITSRGIVSSNEASIWNRTFNVSRYSKGTTDSDSGVVGYFRGVVQSSAYASFLGFEIPLASNSTYFSFSGSRWTFSILKPASGSFNFGLYCDGAYLIYSTDRDVVDYLISIVNQLRSTGADVQSCLSVLNSILAQCQSIKADTSAILGVLQAVQAQLVTLNGKVDDIYTLLKDSLSEESAAIDDQAQRLGDDIMQRVDSEQYWSDKNTETFEALDMGNWTFGDGVVGALPTVGNLFKSLWDSIGEVTLVFVFPLMLGIALVIVGRISRTSGRGHKKGGDDG